MDERQKGGAVSVIKECKTRDEATKAIKKHWETVWGKSNISEGEVDRMIEKHIQVRRMKWERPGDEDFIRAFKEAKGTGGTDGWDGEEISVLPEEGAKRFKGITKRLEKEGERNTESEKN